MTYYSLNFSSPAQLYQLQDITLLDLQDAVLVIKNVDIENNKLLILKLNQNPNIYFALHVSVKLPSNILRHLKLFDVTALYVPQIYYNRYLSILYSNRDHITAIHVPEYVDDRFFLILEQCHKIKRVNVNSYVTVYSIVRMLGLLPNLEKYSEHFNSCKNYSSADMDLILSSLSPTITHVYLNVTYSTFALNCVKRLPNIKEFGFINYQKHPIIGAFINKFMEETNIRIALKNKRGKFIHDLAPAKF